MRKPNLRIREIEKGEEYQLRGTVNIFNKIIEENFPTLKNEMTVSIKEAFRTPNRLDQKRNTSRHIIVKTSSAQSKERILKAVREKGQVTYKGRPIRLTPDFSTETMKARRAWTDIMYFEKYLPDLRSPILIFYFLLDTFLLYLTWFNLCYLVCSISVCDHIWELTYTYFCNIIYNSFPNHYLNM